MREQCGAVPASALKPSRPPPPPHPRAQPSPNGKLFATGSADKSVRIWDMETHALVKVLEGHTSHVLTLAWSADSAKLVTGSWDETMRIWDVATGAIEKVFSANTKVRARVRARGQWAGGGPRAPRACAHGPVGASVGVLWSVWSCAWLRLGSRREPSAALMQQPARAAAAPAPSCAPSRSGWLVCAAPAGQLAVHIPRRRLHRLRRRRQDRAAVAHLERRVLCAAHGPLGGDHGGGWRVRVRARAFVL